MGLGKCQSVSVVRPSSIIVSITETWLTFSQAHYGDLTDVFSSPLRRLPDVFSTPLSLRISALSANLELKFEKSISKHFEFLKRFCLARENWYNLANFKDNIDFFFWVITDESLHLVIGQQWFRVSWNRPKKAKNGLGVLKTPPHT